MCRFFQVSRSGYYEFVHRLGRPEKDAALAEIIAEQRERSFHTYGYRRMWLVLEKQGIHRNPKTILRIMEKYGLLNARPNAQAFATDSSYYLLCSLEIVNEQGTLERKADIFTKRTIRQQRTVEHVDTAVEALALSIGERAGVDLPYMAHLTGKTQEDLIQDLTGVIFPVPGTEPLRYVTADDYLSGNVRQKLREAQAAAAEDAMFQPNVTALEAAQPKDLEASEIDLRLGAT